MRLFDPRRDEWQLWRLVTHPAVPPHDEVGRLDNANVQLCCENTIPGCVTRFTRLQLRAIVQDGNSLVAASSLCTRLLAERVTTVAGCRHARVGSICAQ